MQPYYLNYPWWLVLIKKQALPFSETTHGAEHICPQESIVDMKMLVNEVPRLWFFYRNGDRLIKQKECRCVHTAAGPASVLGCIGGRKRTGCLNMLMEGISVASINGD